MAALIYLTVGRPWVEQRYANTQSSHPVQSYIHIEGGDFVSVTDARLLTIVSWEAALVSALGLLRYAARGRGRFRAPALTAATLLVTAFLGEVGVRIHHKRSHGLPYLLPLEMFYDPVLGEALAEALVRLGELPMRTARGMEGPGRSPIPP